MAPGESSLDLVLDFPSDTVTTLDELHPADAQSVLSTSHSSASPSSAHGSTAAAPDDASQDSDSDSDDEDALIGTHELVIAAPPGEKDKEDVGRALEEAVRSPQTVKSSILAEQPSSIDSTSEHGHASGVEEIENENGEADEEGDEEEDGEDEDEDDEEEEPILKYSKLTPLLTTLLSKDSASAIIASSQIIAIGTHAGMVYVLSHKGVKLNEYRAHGASVMAIEISDDGSEFIGTCSIDGKVVINSLLSTERYIHDFSRPMRSLALQPNFAKSSSKSFVCGGLSGTLSLMEKGWHLGGLGGFVGGGQQGKHTEKVLSSGEGPVWNVKWERGGLIAWANDLGVKIFDTQSQRLLSFIDRPSDAPRADILKPSLTFISPLASVSPVHQPTQLIVAWADTIKLVRIRTRTSTSTSRPSSLHGASLPGGSTQTTGASHTTLHVEITAILQLDAPMAALVPYKDSFLVFAYLAAESKAEHGSFYNDDKEDGEDESDEPQRPELRIISRKGEELSSDALGLEGWLKWRCSDYSVIPLPLSYPPAFVVLSPKEIVVARERDAKDHIEWLVERRRYEEALDLVERLVKEGGRGEGEMTVRGIGEKFLDSLVQAGDWTKAASLLPKVLGQDKSAWEDWVFLFAQKQQLQAIIPVVPTEKPQLGDMVYELILAFLLSTDRPALLKAIKTWSPELYKLSSVVNAVEGVLSEEPGDKELMNCLAELFILNHQPAKALPYFLRLRRPNVFDLIRKHNLFAAVQDQVLLLVEFDMELDDTPEKDIDGQGKRAASAQKHGRAIELLVDHVHSIPIDRVIKQLAERPKYQYMYLDCLFSHDPHTVAAYGDQQIALCAEFDHPRLMDLLRIGVDYSLEKAFEICKERDYVPEMVFLLGRMGNAKEALMLIINRLGDVQRAIEFAREQDDEDIWEDLLRYSEDKPLFIRALLENVGADIDPMLLIKRIRNGMEIPGLKDALIKILQDFSLQISLLEGCQKILDSDSNEHLVRLYRGATHGLFGHASPSAQVLRTIVPL